MRVSGFSIRGGPGRSSGYALPGSGAGGYVVPPWIPVTRTAGAVESDPNNYATITDIGSVWTFTIDAGLANQTLDGVVGSGVTRPPAMDIPLTELYPSFDPSIPQVLLIRARDLVMPAPAANVRLNLGVSLLTDSGGTLATVARGTSVGPSSATTYNVNSVSAGAVVLSAAIGSTLPSFFVSNTNFSKRDATGASLLVDTWGSAWATGVVVLVRLVSLSSTTTLLDPTLYKLRIYVGKRPSGVAVAGGEVVEGNIEAALMPIVDFWP